MMTNVLADPEHCRAYLVTCAARRARRRATMREAAAHLAGIAVISLGILTVAWSFLRP